MKDNIILSIKDVENLSANEAGMLIRILCHMARNGWHPLAESSLPTVARVRDRTFDKKGKLRKLFHVKEESWVYRQPCTINPVEPPIPEGITGDEVIMTKSECISKLIIEVQRQSEDTLSDGQVSQLAHAMHQLFDDAEARACLRKVRRNRFGNLYGWLVEYLNRLPAQKAA
jgi:hypothetical protein